MRHEDDGNDADGRLPVFLGVPGLQRGAEAQAGRLLRLVLLWHRALSTGAGRRRVLRVMPVQRINAGLGRIRPVWLYALAVLPPAWFLWLGLTGGLGAEPIKELEHRLGELALQVFIATLAVRPLREWAGINLMKQRRALGVVTFAYVLLHLLVWLVLDIGILSEIWADIVKRPYITVGMAAFALMLPLAVTSNNLALRRLGPVRWRKLHRLTYPAAVLAALHFVMLAKGFQVEPLVYLGIVLALVVARLGPVRRTSPA